MSVQDNRVHEAIHWLYESYQRAKSFHQNRLIQSGGFSVDEDVFARPDREIRHPEWTEVLLDEFGRPERSAYNVAVTGSKGKGSHAVLIAGMLQKLGLRVGLFTGPHLIDFMERFRVNGLVMPEADFVTYVNRVRAKAAGLDLPEGEYIGPVGLLAVVAALWFRDKNTDVNVFELGRGALHDDVNRVWHQGAIVTPVFMEHLLQLGPTLADVGREKAAVVTSDTRWVWTGSQSPEVLDHLRQRAQATGAWLGQMGKQAHFTVTALDREGQRVIQVQDEWGRALLRVSRSLLPENVSTAAAAARCVWRDVRPQTPWPDELDLTDLVIPGRFQVVRQEPLTLVDGTIHRSSAHHVMQWLEEQLARTSVSDDRKAGVSRRPFVGAVLGLPTDKDGVGMLEELEGRVDWLGFAKAHNPYLKFNHTWISLADAHFPEVAEFDYVEQALKHAEQRVGKQGVLLVLGTQSFVADALACLQVDTRAVWRGV